MTVRLCVCGRKIYSTDVEDRKTQQERLCSPSDVPLIRRHHPVRSSEAPPQNVQQTGDMCTQSGHTERRSQRARLRTNTETILSYRLIFSKTEEPLSSMLPPSKSATNAALKPPFFLLFCAAFKSSPQLGPLWHKNRINLRHFTIIKAAGLLTWKPLTKSICHMLQFECNCSLPSVSFFTYELAAAFQSTHTHTPPRHQLEKRALINDHNHKYWSFFFIYKSHHCSKQWNMHPQWKPAVIWHQKTDKTNS